MGANNLYDSIYSLLATFEEMGNPFLEDSGDMLTLCTKVVISQVAKMLTLQC